jgi:nicotinate-nucleotide adenylyltransferase
LNIALFGGTFDPIHTGHVRAARAAQRRFQLQRVLFVPSGNPPHKHGGSLSPYVHRFAMVALACAGEPRFVPSLLESPRRDGAPHYSIQTVRRLRKMLGPDDRLYFILGLDAFLDLPHWKNYRQLLGATDFIVVQRPGYQAHAILQVLPPRLVRSLEGPAAGGTVRLERTEVHVLGGVKVPAASRQIRENLRIGRSVAGLLPPLVEEYIRKEKVYPQAGK